MNSRLSASEEALATLSCARIADRTAPRILIGGLGMGFTLRAALGVLGPKAHIVVAELLPAVVAWAHGPMADLFASSLDDPRVTVEVADVAKVIAGGRWDAILLDVDNGPEAMTQAANDGLYSAGGLAAVRRALKPGGVLAVWSEGPAPAFSKLLKRSGYDAEEVRVAAHRGKSGRRHVVWVAVAASNRQR